MVRFEYQAGELEWIFERPDIRAEGEAEGEGSSSSDAAPADPAPEAVPSVKERIEEAKARVADGGSMLPGETPAEGAPDAPAEAAAADPSREPHPTIPGRDKAGRILAIQEGDAGATEESTAAPAEGEPEGAEAAPAEAVVEPEAEGAAELFTVPIAGRRPDDPPLEVETDDPVLAERLRQQNNAAMRGSEYRQAQAELATAQSEISEIETALETNPAGFLTSKIHPDLRKKVLLEMLSDPEVYAEVGETLRGWEYDPRQRELDAAKIETERAQAELQHDKLSRIRTRARSSAEAISGELDALIVGNGLDGIAADQFWKYALTQIRQVMESTGRADITPEQAVQYLENQGTLRAYGIDPTKASRSPGKGADTNSSSAAAGRSNGSPAPAVDRSAHRVGARLRAASDRRREAAATAPTGAGAAPSQVPLPEGQTVKERIATVRERGFGSLFGRG